MAEPVKVERYTRTSRVALPIAAAIVIGAATVPAWGSSNIMKQSVTLLTLIALSQMWNLLAGYAGLVSVGQQAFVGIGAYTLWVFSEKFGMNPFVCVPIAGMVAALFAVPTAGLAFRLRGGYFAVGTWVIAEVVPSAGDSDTVVGRRLGREYLERWERRPAYAGIGDFLAGSGGRSRVDRPRLPAAPLAARPRPHGHPGRRDRSPRAGGECQPLEAVGLHHLPRWAPG